MSVCHCLKHNWKDETSIIFSVSKCFAHDLQKISKIDFQKKFIHDLNMYDWRYFQIFTEFRVAFYSSRICFIVTFMTCQSNHSCSSLIYKKMTF